MAKVGFIPVTKEILESEYWPKLHIEISKFFKELCRKEVGNGVTELHGESDLFEQLPEGSTKSYTPKFSVRGDNFEFTGFE